MKLKELKIKKDEFMYRNKDKIKCAKIILECAVVAGITALVIDNRKKAEILECQNAIMSNMAETIINKDRIIKEKDDYFKQFISKLLREGNSEGAKEMVNRREYLNSLKS